MSNLAHLKKRLKMVRNVAKVTKAMQVAASLKMKKAQEKAEQGRDYVNYLGKMEEMTSSVSGTGQVNDFRNNPIPDLKEQVSSGDLVILVAPDRGFCGSLFSDMRKGLASVKGEGWRVMCMNKKAGILARILGVTPEWVFEVMVGKPSQMALRPVVQEVRRLVKTNQNMKVFIGYAKFINIARYEFRLDKIWSRLEAGEKTDTNAILEPNIDEVQKNIEEMKLLGRIYQGILEMSASEFSARAMAMRSASDNASDIAQFLNSLYNKSRQTMITAQIAEVVGASL